MLVPLSTHVLYATGLDGDSPLVRDGLARTLIMTTGLQLLEVPQAATDLYAIIRVRTSRPGEPCKGESLTPPSVVQFPCVHTDNEVLTISFSAHPVEKDQSDSNFEGLVWQYVCHSVLTVLYATS
jgi:hypothetical protein